MVNTLKAKMTIRCNTCGCKIYITKTIKVQAEKKEDAIIEANQKVKEWEKKQLGRNCHTCQSIIDSI